MLGLHQFLNSMSYNDLQVKFTKGDKLLLFTDGLVDSKNAAREEFGMDRITKIVKNSFNRPVSQIGGNIINESQKFRGDQPSSDDVCLLGLEVVE
jgi:sigma-B regulation protein RsbU (phosphoserine phosphatase)